MKSVIKILVVFLLLLASCSPSNDVGVTAGDPGEKLTKQVLIYERGGIEFSIYYYNSTCTDVFDIDFNVTEQSCDIEKYVLISPKKSYDVRVDGKTRLGLEIKESLLVNPREKARDFVISKPVTKDFGFGVTRK